MRPARRGSGDRSRQSGPILRCGTDADELRQDLRGLCEPEGWPIASPTTSAQPRNTSLASGFELCSKSGGMIATTNLVETNGIKLHLLDHGGVAKTTVDISTPHLLREKMRRDPQTPIPRWTSVSGDD